MCSNIEGFDKFETSAKSMTRTMTLVKFDATPAMSFYDQIDDTLKYIETEPERGFKKAKHIENATKKDIWSATSSEYSNPTNESFTKNMRKSSTPPELIK